MKKILLILYLVILFRITVFRSGLGIENLFQNGNINLTLFTEYFPLLRSGDWFRFIYLFVGNIVWFVPFGMYLEQGKRVKPLWKILLCGLALSLCIETLQYVFGTGVSELDDLILNTLGCGCGALFVKTVRKLGELKCTKS